MQRKVLIQAVALALIAVVGAVGCKPKPKVTQPVGGATGTGLTGATDIPVGTGTDTATGGRGILTAADEATRGQFTPVYFDYDSARIKPMEMGKLQSVVTALKGNAKKLVVEGHCDERGTAEYNRALGERRAQAARTELIKLGVDGTRITTISFGKDRPVDPTHDDTAWSRNRRAEFVTSSQ
jgi:peptidoglycan-associated lipoprotein